MSSRNDLRKLGRLTPAAPEIEELMNELQAANDMEAALLAVAMLEVELERLLKARFQSQDAELMNQLFLNRGPLSDLHSKLLVSQAFGLITNPMAHELHSLKAIRNAFAHARARLTFDHPAVAKEIASLKMIAAMKANAEGGKPDFAPTSKGAFLLTTRVMLVMFDEIRKHGGTADHALRDALYNDDFSTPH